MFDSCPRVLRATPFFFVLACRLVVAVRDDGAQDLTIDVTTLISKAVQPGAKLTKDELSELVTQSQAVIAQQSCADLTTQMVSLLDRIDAAFVTHQACRTCSETDTCNLCSTAVLETNLLFVTTLSSTAFSKRCLRSLYFDAQVQTKLASLLGSYLPGLLADAQAKALNAGKTYDLMLSWQEALQQFTDAELFYDPLMDTNLTKSCPSQCKTCTRQHKSWLKGEEKFKFKCVLKGKELPEPKDKIVCEPPRRRFTKPWQKKTWCAVQDWRQMAARQAKVSAILSCSMMVLSPNLKEDLIFKGHKACMAWQQGLVLSHDMGEKVLTKLVASIKNVLRGPEYYLLTTLVALGRGAGLAQLIHGSKEASTEGDGSETGPQPAADASAIAVFRQNRTVNSEDGAKLFLEAIEGELRLDVCSTPTSKGGVAGFFGNVMRQMLRLALLPVMAGLSIVLQSVLYLVLIPIVFFLIGQWNALPPHFLAYPIEIVPKLLTTVPAAWWHSLGRFVHLADYDCEPARFVNPGTKKAQCVPGMYKLAVQTPPQGGPLVECKELGFMEVVR